MSNEKQPMDQKNTQSGSSSNPAPKNPSDQKSPGVSEPTSTKPEVKKDPASGNAASRDQK